MVCMTVAAKNPGLGWPAVGAPDRRSRRRHRRVQILLIVALVVGLHAGVIVILLARPVRIAALLEKPATEVIYLPQTRVTAAVVPEAPNRDVRHSVNASARAESSGKPPALELLRSPARKAPSAENPPAETPPAVDWVGEIAAQAARTTTSTTRQFKDFGFPRSGEPASARAPEFGWDYAHTHRVESLPGGGIVINLNDNCVLLLFPLPFAACAVGKKPANWELFKDMRTPRE
jgi:hypothetical protein